MSSPIDTRTCTPTRSEPASAVIERIIAPKPIEIRLLCPKPAVAGLSVDPPAKQLSVICYLAFHRSVTSQRLRDTFWPTATSRKTADNAISQVHSILGLTADGENRLTQAINSGEYELGEFALEIDQLTVANWSAGIGLAMVPGSEAMYRLQMRAASAEGSSRRIHEAFRAAEQAASTVGPWAEVERETDGLFTNLTRQGEAQEAS